MGMHKKGLKVKELIEDLKNFNPEAQVIISSDEELNCLFKGIDITNLEDKNKIVIYGLSGLELEED